MDKYFFTSESVTEGHPDKVCDRISDSILDALYSTDINARVACETIAKSDTVYIVGEITTTAQIDAEKIARDSIKYIGYTDNSQIFSADNCKVIVNLSKQSPDIAMGVNDSFETKEEDDKMTGAGDQGMVFGYACTETEELMPLPITLAHKLTKKLTEVRKNNTLNYLRPDGKSQVTVEYDNNKPTRVDTVVISTQHSDKVNIEKIREDIIAKVIKPVLNDLMDDNTKIYVNPTGRFVVGGPEGDSGLTGRKIIVDTYGGYCGHGGGAFSGKDVTKVDRSACYAARYVAKNIVASGVATKCEVQISYAIGVAYPVSVYINTFGTSKYTDEQISKAVTKTFDLTPDGIIKMLDLKNTKYAPLSSYGHFGRTDLDVKWEDTDLAQIFLDNLK